MRERGVRNNQKESRECGDRSQEQALEVAVQAGAKTINIPDTVGYIMPTEYQQMISKISKRFPEIIFSVHCHDDLGLATANHPHSYSTLWFRSF